MSPFSRTGFWLCLFLSSCVLAVDHNLPLSDDASVNQRNTCAMTQVLQAMNDLLSVLSKEIRDLKKQVQTSCTGRDRPRPIIPEAETGEKKKQDKDVDDDQGEDDIFESFGKKEDKETPTDEYDTYGDYDDGKTPGEEIIDGFSNWWNSIAPFAKPTEGPSEASEDPPEPSEDPSKTSETPVIRPTYPGPVVPDYGDRAGDRYGEGDDGDDRDDDGFDYSRPDYWYERNSTTTTEIPYYAAPPEPTSCPTPFRHQAGGCYLVFHDQRDWRSWGEAHAFCQNYGGSLAAPWRLRQLQAFLSKYYSNAFWVGAKLDIPSSTWKWLSGRYFESSTWKQGQPNTHPGMRCVFLDRWSGYQANSYFCGEKYPFICDYRQEGDA